METRNVNLREEDMELAKLYGKNLSEFIRDAIDYFKPVVIDRAQERLEELRKKRLPADEDLENGLATHSLTTPGGGT